MTLFCLDIRTPKINQPTLLNIRARLTIAPQQRSNEDHNIIYLFFHQKEFFQKMQRTHGIIKVICAITYLKSISVNKEQNLIKNLMGIKYIFILNGSLTMLKGQQKSRFFQGTTLQDKDLEDITQMYTKEGCELALLSQNVYEELNIINQKFLRDTVETLKIFTIFSNINFLHMIYLASASKIKKFRFKEIVYESEAEPEYWYGILKGQFEFVTLKKFAQHRYQIGTKNQHQKQEKRIQLSVLQQKQSFGEEEIVLNCKRKYQMISISSDNEVITIPAKNLMVVILMYPELLVRLKKQIQIRNKWKEEFGKNISKTKNNYQKVIKNMIEESEKLKKLPTLSLTERKSKSPLKIVEIYSEGREFKDNSIEKNDIEKNINIMQQKQSYIQNIVALKSIQQQQIQTQTFGLTETRPDIVYNSRKKTQKKDTEIEKKISIMNSQQDKNYNSLTNTNRERANQNRKLNKDYQYNHSSQISLQKKSLKLPAVNQSSIPDIKKIDNFNHGILFKESRKEEHPINAEVYIDQKQEILYKILNQRINFKRQFSPLQLDRRHRLQIPKSLKIQKNKNVAKSRRFMEYFLKDIIKSYQDRRVVNIGVEGIIQQKQNKQKKQEDDVLQDNPFDKIFMKI